MSSLDSTFAFRIAKATLLAEILKWKRWSSREPASMPGQRQKNEMLRISFYRIERAAAVCRAARDRMDGKPKKPRNAYCKNCGHPRSCHWRVDDHPEQAKRSAEVRAAFGLGRWPSSIFCHTGMGNGSYCRCDEFVAGRFKGGRIE